MERIFFALVFLPILLFGVAAYAGPRPCAAHDKIAEALSQEYGESAHAMGLAEDDTVMELYAAPKTGTWTLTVTLPDGTTCLVATGKNFESIQPTQVSGEPT